MVQINTNISCQIRIGVIELSFANNLNLITRLLLMEQSYILALYIYIHVHHLCFVLEDLRSLNMELHEVLSSLFATKTRHVKMYTKL
jgi:hypothetical protein